MKKSKKNFLFGALAALGVCSGCLAFSFANADATTDFVSDGTLQEIYYVGDILNVPQGSFGEYAAQASIYCPNGTVYKADEISLETYGEYKVVYSATIDGTYYSHEETFKTLAKVNSFTGENSTAVYGTDEKSGREGILVGVAEGETYRYNDIINTYETNEQNPAISMAFSPSVEGNWDATEVYLSLIDVYDEENKVELWIRLKEGIISNVVAKATNQNWGAYLWSGNTYTLSINTGNGTSIYAGNSVHAGSLNTIDVFKNQRLEFWLDGETKQLFVGTRRVFGWNEDLMILDLDNATEQTYPWKGFTTGEAYLEITCKNYSSDKANFVLSELGGNDLSKQVIEDTEGPQIDVEAKNYEIDAMPLGLQNAAYPVFNVTAKDKYSGNVAAETRVFFGYERGNGTYDSYGSRYAFEVPIQDGRFIPTNAGTYAIVYRSKDFIGNVSEKVVTVEIGKDIYAPLSEITIENQITAIETGNILSLAKLSAFGGGVAPLTVKYEVTFGNKKIALSGNEYDGYWFVPQTAGTYTVTVAVEDFIGNAKKVEYAVVVAAATKASFATAPVLPKYLISDVKYSLPALTANKNGQEVPTSIKIIDGNGESVYKNEAVFKADENGFAEIVYEASDNQISYKIPVVTTTNDTGLDITKYFNATNGVSLTPDSTGLRIGYTEKGEAEFIREVFVHDLQFGFNFHSFRAGKFSVCLTDYANPSASIKISFVGKGDYIQILCNDEAVAQTIAITPNGVVPVKVKYDYERQAITVGDGIAIAVKNNIFGKAFENFNSNKCYLRFVSEEYESEYAVQITNIRGQWINEYVQSDTIAPELHLYENYGDMVYSIGEIFTTIPASFADVLDPYVKGTVTVSLDGEILSTLDGIKMSKLSCAESHQVRLEHLGTYIVSYKLEDGSKNDYTLAYKIVVKDDIAPTIKIDGNIPETLTVGTFTIPSFTATDELGEVKDAYITLVTPQGKVMLVEAGAVNLSLKGKYLLTYYAMDDSGNVAKKSFYIQVA